jgi:hypothetical protein
LRRENKWQGINVPIGPATVEYGEGADLVTFDITKGGIKFQATTNKQDITVDQYGDTPVKSIMKGRTCEVTVPFALHDLEKLSKVIPNSTFTKSGTAPTKSSNSPLNHKRALTYFLRKET